MSKQTGADITANLPSTQRVLIRVSQQHLFNSQAVHADWHVSQAKHAVPFEHHSRHQLLKL